VLADALLAEAVRDGWLTPPRLVAEGPPPRRPMTSWRQLSEGLESDREER
jgi:hypothetical protein